jgi:hypothetical protein
METKEAKKDEESKEVHPAEPNAKAVHIHLEPVEEAKERAVEAAPDVSPAPHAESAIPATPVSAKEEKKVPPPVLRPLSTIGTLDGAEDGGDDGV